MLPWREGWTAGAPGQEPIRPARDGHISGRTLELDLPRRIVQSWRSSDFEPADADSRIEVVPERVPEGTRITLTHSAIPDGQTGYEQGWRGNYFDPMREYFARGI